VFSGGNRYHTVAMDARLLGKGPEGASFNEVLKRFWDGGGTEKVLFRYEESP
jgi:hypothetical protein